MECCESMYQKLKTKEHSNINLTLNKTIIEHPRQVSETLNKYFTEVAHILEKRSEQQCKGFTNITNI